MEDNWLIPEVIEEDWLIPEVSRVWKRIGSSLRLVGYGGGLAHP